MIPTFLAIAVAIAVAVRYVGGLISKRLERRRLPLPPGPKGYPIIGNLFDMPGPSALGWLSYDEWLKRYGDMVYFEVVGQPFLLLGSLERVYDIMERRSSNYSDRVQSVMLGELMGWWISFGMTPYGLMWRNARRHFHNHFNIRAAKAHRDIHLDEGRRFAAQVLNSPQDLHKHIRRVFAGTIMRICYGIPVESEDSEYIKLPEIAFEGIAAAVVPGAFLVDFFPLMKHIPSWFPGAGWKRKAEYWCSVTRQIVDLPFQVVKGQREKGVAPPSVALSLIESLPPKDDPRYTQEEQYARNVPATAYVGGADTTVSSVQALVLALALNPLIAKKAQEEIDAVVGQDRLPDFNDHPHLHYVRAICKEILRWHNVAPLGVPHVATEPDEYNGYYIPKGTIVIAASWSILHDPNHYEDPLTFKPERFIKDGKFNTEVLDPRNAGAFGFGRRGCPGRNTAEDSLYSLVVALLAVFDIRPQMTKEGTPEELKYEVTPGFVSYPKPFSVHIEPRSPRVVELIRSYALPE